MVMVSAGLASSTVTKAALAAFGNRMTAHNPSTETNPGCFFMGFSIDWFFEHVELGDGE
jgi:hypothetical protein